MVIIFQLIGAEVAIRRMATHTVVKQFDVFKDTEIRFLFGGDVFSIERFNLKASEERFHRCVIPTIAVAAHTRLYLFLKQEPLILPGTALHNAI